MNKYPEHKKLSAVKDQSQAIGQFLDWLNDQGIELASYHVHSESCNGSSPCYMGHYALRKPPRSLVECRLERFAGGTEMRGVRIGEP